MGAYRYTHSFVLDDALQTEELFFYFQNRAKERAEKCVGHKLKWEKKLGEGKLFSRVSPTETFRVESLHFEYA